MTTSHDPCSTCGGAVTLVQVRDQRAAGSAVVERRTCTNPDCRTNGPRSQRRFSDTV